jgi:replicative DNA helicase Mcm
MKITIIIEDNKMTLKSITKLLKIIDENNLVQLKEDSSETEIDHGVLAGRPQSEISKLRLFMEVFNGLSGPDKNDVLEDDFLDEIEATGRFDRKEAKQFLAKALQNGQIYERRKDWYAKA